MLSCTKDYQDVNNFDTTAEIENEQIFFSLLDSEGSKYNAFLINDSIIHVKVPHDIDLSKLTPLFYLGEGKVSEGNEELKSGFRSLDFSDFLNPIILKQIQSNEEDKLLKVNIYDIPVLIMNTPDGKPIESKEIRTEGCVFNLIDNDCVILNLGEAGVKGRGNSTWAQPKKPYNIKFEKKQSLFGMAKSKHWVLLSQPYYDRTQLHNATAFEMARLTDYPWVQNGAFVELIINGKHQGLYYLTEKIRAEEGRIEIGDVISDDNLDGGFLLESAFHELTPEKFQTDFFNKTNSGSPLFWEVNEPDDPNSSIVESCKGVLNNIERLIYEDVKSGAYREFIDIETAINWMLVEEVSLNQESLNPSNLFLYKTSGGGKIFFGPPWDFDAFSFGLVGTNKMYLQRSSFYFYYFFKDPIFVNRLKEKWSTIRDVWIDNIPKFIDEKAKYLRRSIHRNEVMWPSWHEVNGYPSQTWEERIEKMKISFLEQLQYVDEQINGL